MGLGCLLHEYPEYTHAPGIIAFANATVSDDAGPAGLSLVMVTNSTFENATDPVLS
jgi:hypothetical protein